MSRPAVRHTVEFDRVAELPRRVLTQADADAWAQVLTPDCVAPGADAALFPWQACAIAEACAEPDRGAVLFLPVGLGKTLITHQVPRLRGAHRPILVVPKALEDKTRADFAAYVGTWRTPSPIPQIVTVERITRDPGILDRIRPDLILIDECDELANRNSAASRRLDRHIVADDSVIVIPMTGSPSRKSIMGYWHLLCWALRDAAPMPLSEGEALSWAAALDYDAPRGNPRQRPLPGPLGASVAAARAWFRDRLAQTPGVVIVDGDSCAQPITIRQRLPRECPILDRHFEMFGLGEAENPDVPDGLIVSDPLSRWRIDGFLGCGLYLRFKERPPEAWRLARRAAARFVREAIAESSYTRRPLDTEGQVFRRFADHPIVSEWLAIKPDFDPETEPVWLSTATIESVLDWIRESPEPGIVWCGSVDFAAALATASRLPYYGPKGRDARTGRGLHAAPVENIIASWNANKRGHNLQAWRRMLITHPPQSAKWIEQIIGRVHRRGQNHPITVDVLVTSGGTLDGFETMVGEAGFARETVSMTQKVLRARIIRATPEITERNRFRWAQRED